MWRKMLAFFGLAAAPAISIGRDALVDLDEALGRHAATARRVEASAHLRDIRSRTDPDLAEMRRLNRERGDAIDAVFRGRDET